MDDADNGACSYNGMDTKTGPYGLLYNHTGPFTDECGGVQPV